MITGENICEFNYKEDVNSYANSLVRNLYLKSLECKHIAFIDSSRTEEIYEWSKKSNYEWLFFGSHREEPSIEKEIEIIESMLSEKYTRALRIVVDQNGRAWTDNTHSTIAYMLKYGYDVKVQDVPYYIVDLRETPYTIVSIKNAVFHSFVDIRNAIACAERIKKYNEKGFRKNSWNIFNLIIQVEPLDIKFSGIKEYAEDKLFYNQVSKLIG